MSSKLLFVKLLYQKKMNFNRVSPRMFLAQTSRVMLCGYDTQNYIAEVLDIAVQANPTYDYESLEVTSQNQTLYRSDLCMFYRETA